MLGGVVRRDEEVNMRKKFAFPVGNGAKIILKVVIKRQESPEREGGAVVESNLYLENIVGVVEYVDGKARRGGDPYGWAVQGVDIGVVGCGEGLPVAVAMPVVNDRPRAVFRIRFTSKVALMGWLEPRAQVHRLSQHPVLVASLPKKALPAVFNLVVAWMALERDQCCGIEPLSAMAVEHMR